METMMTQQEEKFWIKVVLVFGLFAIGTLLLTIFLVINNQIKYDEWESSLSAGDLEKITHTIILLNNVEVGSLIEFQDGQLALISTPANNGIRSIIYITSIKPVLKKEYVERNPFGSTDRHFLLRIVGVYNSNHPLYEKKITLFIKQAIK